MFIRYNDTLKFWEYDTSAGQTGAGPWNTLQEIFRQDILIDKPLPRVIMMDRNGTVDFRQFQMFVNIGKITIQSVNDAINVGYGQIVIDTGGNIQATGYISEQNRATPMGFPADVVYNAGDYTSDTGAWTVGSANVLQNRYSIVGKMMTWAFIVNGTTITGTPSELRIKIPGGNTMGAARYDDLIFANPNGVNSVARMLAFNSASYISLFKLDASAWSGSVGFGGTLNIGIA